MKPYITIGRGTKSPLAIRIIKSSAVAEYLSAFAIFYHSWKWFGIIVLDNFK